MDDRERLYALAKENGLEPHSRHGVPKLMEMLQEAGIDPDLEIPHARAPKADLEGEDTPEPEKAPPAPAKSQSGMVEVIVMARVHVQPTDIGERHSEMSTRLDFRTRTPMKRKVAEMLQAQGKVEIV